MSKDKVYTADMGQPPQDIDGASAGRKMKKTEPNLPEQPGSGIRVDGKPLPPEKKLAKGGSASSPFFFKDGYTDIRGKFDYSQTSGNRLKDVERFAILIMSDTLRSIIKECDPPKSTESDSGNGASDGGMAQQKADRIISRVNAVKCSKK